MAQLDAHLTGGRGFDLCLVRQYSLVETDHEIFSRDIFSLPLIQERQLSVSGKRMCTYWLTACRTNPVQEKVRIGKLITIDMRP